MTTSHSLNLIDLASSQARVPHPEPNPRAREGRQQVSRVAFAAGELLIDGRPRILLVASVFPFRIPRAQWADRLATVAALGYGGVDVYIPWNFHEVSPGTWDFGGQRDIEHFLELCAAQGLLVVARPGPYICSEWDGGGLPAWLTTTAGLRLRQNEPLYLAQVRRWFDKVLPMLERHQLGREGSIALVQVENELDFFDCEDPEGYIRALRDMMREHGIVVPLIACAGQGDITRAGGRVPDVAPAVNLYPSDESVDIEDQVSYYERATRGMEMPLLVTETNRLHRTLKRLLVGGVRLIGPYLQASGWNSGYTTAVNNWGDLLAFMTHDYDFGGMVRPDGTLRADAEEARILGGLIDALGETIASGTPQGQARHVQSGLTVRPRALNLANGGELISLTNLADDEETVRVSATGPRGEIQVAARVPAGVCLLLVRELPLAGVAATLVATTGELTLLETLGARVKLRLTGRSATGALDAVIDGITAVVSASGNAEVALESGDPGGRCRVVGSEGEVQLETTAGHITLCLATTRDDQTPEPGKPASVDITHVDASDPTEDLRGRQWNTRQDRGPARTLEAVGALAGSGRYTSQHTLPADAFGVVLRGPADVVQLLSPRGSLEWVANGGGDRYLPLASPAHPPATQADAIDVGDRLTVVTRTWGHSNFDDARLPSLRLGSQRGLTGAFAVTAVTGIDEGWFVAAATPEGSRAEIGTDPRPRSSFGSWMSSTFPQTIRYSRRLSLRDLGGQTGVSAAIRAEGLAVRIDVEVEGVPVGVLTPLTPLVWLGALAPDTQLAVVVHRSWGEDTGSLALLAGPELDDWEIATCEEGDLARARDRARPVARRLPLDVPPGTSRWVRVGIPRSADTLAEARGSVLRFRGRGLLITCFVADQMLARIWTDSPRGAELRGGRGDLLLVPGPSTPATIDLLLEATGGDAGWLEGIEVGGPIDR